MADGRDIHVVEEEISALIDQINSGKLSPAERETAEERLLDLRSTDFEELFEPEGLLGESLRLSQLAGRQWGGSHTEEGRQGGTHPISPSALGDGLPSHIKNSELRTG